MTETFNLWTSPYFKAEKIASGTWQVLSDGDYTYVLEGEDELICIDGGCGAGNIRAFCQSLSDKPLYRLLNTHNHFDHTASNYLLMPSICPKSAIRNAAVLSQTLPE